MCSDLRLIFFLGLLVVLPAAGLGQGFSVESRKLPSIADVSTDTSFTSLTGRFAIALPLQISGFGPISQNIPGGNMTGAYYTWATVEAAFRVTYIDRPDELSKEAIAAMLTQLRNSVAKTAEPGKGKIVSERMLTLNGNPGNEIVLEQDGAKGVIRCYIVGKRLYQIIASLPKNEELKPALLKALDSFSLLSEEQIQLALRKKIESAAPAPLPQEPVAPKLKSDAEDEGLKGRIKLIETEDQDSSGTWTVQTRKLSNIEYYDQRGNLTKRESWDYQGNPFEITVYGYLDGTRVSKNGTVQYEYNPPAPMALPPPPGQSTSTSQRDTRYSFKHTYKYDNQGRLSERALFTNDGKLWQRIVSTYEKRQTQILYYSETGKLNSKYVEKLDEQGLVIEKEDWDVTTGKLSERYAYQYEVDSRGNWTKRITLKWTTKDGQSSFVPFYTTWRKIIYYEN